MKLAAEGAKVCLNYFDNEADAQETLALIKNVGGEAIAVQGDMTKAAAVKNLFAECNKAFGDKVDVLVNVVGGIVGRKKITEQDEDWYDFLMDVNMRSVFLCTREVVPMMTAGGSYALRREGTAEEVADLVCFLACSESSYLTGTNIDINGGCFFS